MKSSLHIWLTVDDQNISTSDLDDQKVLYNKKDFTTKLELSIKITY